MIHYSSCEPFWEVGGTQQSPKVSSATIPGKQETMPPRRRGPRYRVRDLPSSFSVARESTDSLAGLRDTQVGSVSLRNDASIHGGYPAGFSIRSGFLCPLRPASRQACVASKNGEESYCTCSAPPAGGRSKGHKGRDERRLDEEEGVIHLPWAFWGKDQEAVMRIYPHLGVSPLWSGVGRTHSAEANISFFPIQKNYPNTNTKNNPGSYIYIYIFYIDPTLQ